MHRLRLAPWATLFIALQGHAAVSVVTGQEIVDKGAHPSAAQARAYLAPGADVEHTAPSDAPASVAVAVAPEAAPVAEPPAASPPPEATAPAPAAPAARTYLTPDGIRQEFLEHRVVHKRLTDGVAVSWEMKSNGMLYAKNLAFNGGDTGTWTLQPDGGLCMKWRGNSRDGCFYIFRDGDHWARTQSAALDAPVYSVIIEVK